MKGRFFHYEKSMHCRSLLHFSRSTQPCGFWSLLFLYMTMFRSNVRCMSICRCNDGCTLLQDCRGLHRPVGCLCSLNIQCFGLVKCTNNVCGGDVSTCWCFIQTEAERRSREARVQQAMEMDSCHLCLVPTLCMHVYMFSRISYNQST